MSSTASRLRTRRPRDQERLSDDHTNRHRETVSLGDANYVQLPLGVLRVEVSGNYTLTLTAADECRLSVGEGHVPEEARLRTYQAAVRQYGPRLAMMLSGATLRSGPIPGRVEPEHVSFNLGFVGRPCMIPTSG